MSVMAANEETRSTIRGILERFLSVSDHWVDARFGKLYSEACDLFQLNCQPPENFGFRFTESQNLSLRDKDHYYVLEPPENKRFLPFITLHSTADWVNFSAYVLLAAFDAQSEVMGLAFRYETDEGDGGGKHDFYHAQVCRSIRRDGPEVTPFLALDSDPALPLEADNQIRLVLCMLTSIYGRQYILEKFDRTDKDVWEQMRGMRALRRIQTAQPCH